MSQGRNFSVPTPTPTPEATTAPAGPIVVRVCNCGWTMDIYTSGLSDAEKATWKAHAMAHSANGESTSYRDKAY